MNSRHLHGLVIRALDGAELGAVDQFYFDDENWAARYFTVETGGWLDRQVLISPFSVLHTDWKARRLDVGLTREQIENSPDIDTHRPVSRQHEAEYLGYYGYPYYWGGPYLWGASFYPATNPDIISTANAAAIAGRARGESIDSRLRSAEEVRGYSIDASDGEIGHLDGFILDDQTWAIRYIEVATRNWWPGKKVLVSPAWIQRVSWPESRVYVGLSREAIRNGPEYKESVPISREYENQLYLHYGLPPYWLNEAERQATFSLSSV